ncbi:MAG: DUF2812 domain-containing protein [Clostridia bacterium]|nr:DUF2812 domain-containing protein [Clostridia bacterium]
MRTTVKKWFWVWEFDKEEQWLNEMAAKGLALVGVGFCRYEFEECVPGEYQVRLELLENQLQHAESQQYIRFLEETGVEQVGNYFRWVYFRKKTADGPFDLYSDLESRIKHLKRIIALVLPISAANLCIGFSNVGNAVRTGIGLANVGYLNLALGLLGCFGAWKLSKKRKRLEAEAQIFE